MALTGKARPFLVLLPLALGGVRQAGGVEQLAESVSVTASKYDVRSSGVADEFKGCYTDGCSPDLMLDGLENDIPESRWSCEEALAGSVTECYATFDLQSSFTLTKLSMWFHESFDESRAVNAFVVSTSDDGSVFVDSFEAENTAGLAVGVADDFTFPTGSTGQFVRVTGVLAVDQWLSISEVEVYVDVATPAPIPATTAPIPPTAAPTTAPIPSTPVPTTVAAAPNATAPPNPAASTAAPTVDVFVDVNTTTTTAPATTPATPAPMATTPSPTVVGGAACANVTVSNVGDLNGDYSRADGASDYVSTGPNAATMAASQTQAECGDASATEDCMVQRWQIKPQDAASTLPTYVVYDEATHPSDISQVWLRLDSCSMSSCTSSPAEVDILCGDGSTAGSVTPAPASATTSDCGIIEVAGTSGAASDGFYYDDGSALADGVAQYQGYDAVNGELTSNGNAVLAKRVDSTCASTSATADACSWRQWWIEPASGGALDYYAFDEMNHPVDIAPGTLWYTSNLTVIPFDGDVTITCAPPATTPTLEPAPVTPAPTLTDRELTDDFTGDDLTRAPVPGLSTDGSTAPAVAAAQDSSEGDNNTPVIVGSVAGGAVLLALVAAGVAYKLKKSPPPPSYDDLVGAA